MKTTDWKRCRCDSYGIEWRSCSLFPGTCFTVCIFSFLHRLLKETLTDNSPEAAARCYFFNSFFYKKLTESTSGGGDGGGGGGAGRQRTLAAGSGGGSLDKTPEELGFERVRKWTRVRNPVPPA